MAGVPTGHGQDAGRRLRLGTASLGARQIEGRQCRIERKIEGRVGAGLTGGKAGKLLAIAEEKRELKPGDGHLPRLVTRQRQVGRSRDTIPGRVRNVALAGGYYAPVTLKRALPDAGGREVEMGGLC